MDTNKRTAILVGILIIVAYTMLLSTFVPQIIGLFTEVISGAAVIGIALLMYPLFKQHKLRISYLLLKVVEGLLMFIAGVFILFSNITMYNTIYAIHVYAFSISAFLFYILLYKTELISKSISIWGMIAAVLVLTANIYTQLGFELPIIGMIIGYTPIILNEIFLAILLIAKGFNKEVQIWIHLRKY